MVGSPLSAQPSHVAAHFEIHVSLTSLKIFFAQFGIFELSSCIAAPAMITLVFRLPHSLGGNVLNVPKIAFLTHYCFLTSQ